MGLGWFVWGYTNPLGRMALGWVVDEVGEGEYVRVGGWMGSFGAGEGVMLIMM